MSNTLSRDEAHTRSHVAAFYKFVSLPHFQDLRAPLVRQCRRLKLKGTILLAQEGINATVSGREEALHTLISYLSDDLELGEITPKFSICDSNPFFRMKVRLKNEIVTMGVPDIDPNRCVGAYVEPDEWNSLIDDPAVTVIDTRNRYETRIGTFPNAIDPQTDSFREFPDFVKTELNPHKHKKLALFCTGGIRCEKATSYLLDQGFDQVFHLRGGILNYLEKTPDNQNRWLGDCFVFDQRVSVDTTLARGTFSMCHACRTPLTEEDQLDPLYEEGVACPHCAPTQSAKNRARAEARQRQVEIAKERGQAHIAQAIRMPELEESN